MKVFNSAVHKWTLSSTVSGPSPLAFFRRAQDGAIEFVPMGLPDPAFATPAGAVP